MTSVQSNPTTATFSSGHALLIGVGADLPVTVKDATALRDVLVDPTRAAYPLEQVELLTEVSATRQHILDAFDRLIERVNQNPDATVIVYFSGHGGRVTSQDNPPEYFLVPHGFDWNQRANTAISGLEFTEKIEAIKAKKLVVMLDCCHAGGVPALKVPGTTFTKSPVPLTLLGSLEGGSGRIVIASSHEEQFSYTGTPYSVFTACLLEALQGKASVAQDGYARILNVLTYLFEQVPTRTLDKQKPFVNKVLDLSDNFPICYYAGGEAKLRSEVQIAEPISQNNFIESQNYLIKQKRERIQRDIDVCTQERQSLAEKIAVIVKALDVEDSAIRVRSLKIQKERYEEEINQIEDKLEKLEFKMSHLT